MLTATDLTNSDSAVYYSALVTDNDDPNKQGRIKIRIESVHADVPDDLLPWALPQINTAGLNVPLKQTYVWVEFQQSIEYEPVYLGNVLPTSYASGILAEDYPNTRGIYDGKNWITINKSSGKIQIHNSESELTFEGSDIKIKSSGNLDIELDGECNITASNLTVNNNSTFNGNLTVNGDITSTGTVTALAVIADTVTANLAYTGVKVVSGHTFTVVGGSVILIT